MRTLRIRVAPARLIGPAVATLLLAGSIAPVSADTDLSAGGTAVIAYANGDTVRLRSGPGYENAIVDRFAEGTTVNVIDGTHTANDGTLWYQVSVDGETGYIVSDYLTNDTLGTAGTSGRIETNTSVNVRSGPSTADSVVVTLPAGETVTLTGGNRDGWLSVSATGGDGWVVAEYLGASDAGDPETPTGGVRYTIDSVHLRSGPGPSYDSLATLPVGVTLQFTGAVENGFAQVESDAGSGWVFAQYIDSTPPADSGDGEESPPPATEEPETPTAPETPVAETRYTLESVNLRAGAGTDSASLAYLEPGVELALLGEVENGFAHVSSAYGEGWVFAQYIGTEAPADTPEEPKIPEAVTRYTIAAVNLRDGASATSSVVQVVPQGTDVTFTGETQDGYAKVTANGVEGWIAAEYLAADPPSIPDPAPEEPEESSLLAWPVSGGEWYVSQGYNGSSHQNQSSSWQYRYSLDLKRSDGNTAGQPVYSAVNGTIRWIDEATGGMSISMGDGLAYSFFHVLLDPGLQEGDTVTQGQYLGTIAPDGQMSNGGTAHLHITIWETADEGNWSRIAIPFAGNVAIEGAEFPASSTGNAYRGYTFNP